MKNKTEFMVLLIISLALSSGCAALLAGGIGAGAGAGAVYYVKGELQANVDATLYSTFTATKRAISNLKFILINAQLDKSEGKVTARTQRDKKVAIKLSKLTDRSTRIAIRIGTFGDKALSREILQEIKKEL